MTAWGSLSRAMLFGFLRDRSALFFTIVFPLMFLVLFGGVFKNQTAPKLTVLQLGAVRVLDELPAAQRAALDQALTITRVSEPPPAGTDPLAPVRKGDAAAAVEERAGTVVLHFSAADPVRAGLVQQVLGALVDQANLAATGTPPRFQLQARQVEDRSLKAIQFVTPGLLGWAVATGATFGAALTLVTWRQKQILRRLRLSPVPTAAVVGARVGVSVGVALAQTAIFLGLAVLPYFGLRLSSWWWLSLPLVLAGTLAFLSLGLLVGAWARTPEAATGLANLVVLPMAFLSGAFFPLDTAPSWLQAVSRLLPLRYLVEGMKDVMVRGEGPASTLPALGVLLGFTAVALLLATRLFRWEDV